MTIQKESAVITRPSQVIELQRMHFDALNSLGHAVLAAAEKLTQLNLGAGRQAIDRFTETARSLGCVADPAAALALTQPSIEQLMSYSRNLVAIGNGLHAEVARVVETQIAEGNRRVSALVEYAARNAPAGSENVVSLLRGAVAAGHSTFDTVTRTARQAAEWADANVAAAANASEIAAASARAPFKSESAA